MSRLIPPTHFLVSMEGKNVDLNGLGLEREISKAVASWRYVDKEYRIWSTEKVGSGYIVERS